MHITLDAKAFCIAAMFAARNDRRPHLNGVRLTRMDGGVLMQATDGRAAVEVFDPTAEMFGITKSFVQPDNQTLSGCALKSIATVRITNFPADMNRGPNDWLAYMDGHNKSNRAYVHRVGTVIEQGKPDSFPDLSKIIPTDFPISPGKENKRDAIAAHLLDRLAKAARVSGNFTAVHNVMAKIDDRLHALVFRLEPNTRPERYRVRGMIAARRGDRPAWDITEATS